MNKSEHWNYIYQSKTPDQMSWTQGIPSASLSFIKSFSFSVKPRVIDVGGGESHLAEYLLDMGYEDITVLDISAEALEKQKQRLGNRAGKIKWIVSDILDFKPEEKYDIWHDRATFHFLNLTGEIRQYHEILKEAVRGYAVMGTFSLLGPEKCSGLPVHRYSEPELERTLQPDFEKIRCIQEDHETPSGKIQNFLFCSFRRNSMVA